MKLKHVNDSEFRMYGRVITGYEVSGLMEEMKKTPLPEDVVYVGSVPELESGRWRTVCMAGCRFRLVTATDITGS